MAKTEARERAGKGTATAGAAGVATPDGADAGKDPLPSKEGGFELFGSRPQNHEAYVASLASFLKTGKPTEAKTGTGEGTEPGNREPGNRGTGEPEGQEGQEGAAPEGESEPETEDEPTEGTGSQEQEEQQEETERRGEGETEGEEEGASAQWPKGAIEKVSELRRERRELRSQIEERDAEMGRMREALESAELKRPIAPTPENPLSFAESPEKLAQWTRNTRAMVGLIEDQLEGGLSGEDHARLQRWAEANGAWNEEEGDFDAGALRRAKRQATEALQEHVPARAQFFEKERAYSSEVASDPILGPIWKDRESQAYKDAMGVLGRIPGIRNFPEWKAMAALYALGLKAYREAKGKGKGKGTGSGETGRRGNGAATAAAATGMRTVKTPGRGAVVPRHVSTAPAGANIQSLQEKIRSGRATPGDMEEYTRLSLTGKIPRSE